MLDSEIVSAELELDGDQTYYSEDSVIRVLKALFAWFVGVLFGPWRVRFGTGEVPWPEVSNPIAPLPPLPLGMLKGADGFAMGREEADGPHAVGSFPVDIAWSGILVDDPVGQADLIRALEDMLSSVWDWDSSQIIQEYHDLFRIDSLCDWFRNSNNFFACHLKCCSKSRRQAPICWWIPADSANYSIWLSYHRFTQDTMYRDMRDFVEPRILQAERDQFQLESQEALSGDSATWLQKTLTLLKDLRILKNDVDLVAPLWNLNLNDGVTINHAILWRVTPYNPWRKNCKECWDKLVKGDYDWAHLAFHLWAERVIPECATERSLAIAHGLEDRLWQETNNVNWLPRLLSEAEVNPGLSQPMSAPPSASAMSARRSAVWMQTRRPSFQMRVPQPAGPRA